MNSAIHISRKGAVFCRMAKPTQAYLPCRQLPWESEPIRVIPMKNKDGPLVCFLALRVE